MPNPVAQAALDLLDIVLQDASPLPEVFSMPVFIPGPTGAIVAIPDAVGLTQKGPGANVFKVVFQFRGVDGSKWSELYFTNASGTAEQIAASCIPLGFIGPRLALLAAPFRLYSVSVTDTIYNRSAIKRTINRVGTAAVGATGVPLPPDLAGSYAYIQWQGTLGGTRKSTMRGLPDAWFRFDSNLNQPVVDAEFKTKLGEWASVLIAGNYGWAPRVKVNKAVPPNVTMYNKIVSVNGSVTAGQATVTCVAPILLPANGSLTISQVDKKLLPGLSGRWFPISSTGNAFVIEYEVAAGANIDHPGGRIRVYQSDAFNKFSGFDVVGSGSRRTANAFTPSRHGQSVRGLRTLV